MGLDVVDVDEVALSEVPYTEVVTLPFPVAPALQTT